MSGKLFGYARVSVASNADANNLSTQRRVLVDCEQVFEGVGGGPSEFRAWLVVSLHETLTAELFGATMLIRRVMPFGCSPGRSTAVWGSQFLRFSYPFCSPIRFSLIIWFVGSPSVFRSGGSLGTSWSLGTLSQGNDGLPSPHHSTRSGA